MLDQTALKVRHAVRSKAVLRNSELRFGAPARLKESGFDHHLVKPVDPDELTNLLDSL